MAERRPFPTATLRGLISIGLLAYAAVVVTTNLLPTRKTRARTEQLLEQIERENAAHERAIDAAERETHALQTDAWAVERALRDEYNMSRPGELVIR